jgi:hemolysin activation/secretion protein
MKHLIPSLVLLCSCSVVGLLAAPPDAGQLLREQQSQTERQPLQRFPERDTSVVTKVAPTAAGTTVLVKAIHFKDYEGLASERDLLSVVKSSIGKNLGLADLQQLADQVTAFLRNKGFFLARAYLPKQDVTAGTIEIAIIQARSEGDVSINRASGVRVRDERLKEVAASVIKPGQPLHESDLERVLLLMNDIPGVTARAVLAPGATPGTTRVTINVSESTLFSSAIWGDNYGNRYTGAWRANGYVSLNDPLHIGDQLNLMVSGASGLAQGRVSYSAPLGGHGLRGNIAYSNMRYKLGEELAAMKGKGTAGTLNAGLTYPLIRSRSFNLSANAGYERKELKDEAYGYNIRNKQLQSGTAGVTGDYSDRLLGGGYTTWSASVTSGDLSLSRNRSDYNADQGRLVYDTSGNYIQVPAPKTSGNYARFNLSGSRLQRLTDRLTLSASYYGQLASKNLDSSEKFTLGGPYGVRAYPVGEASGDEGNLINVELRDDLPWGAQWGNLQVIGFLDTGSITLYKDPWPGAVTNATHKNEYWLSGTGLGVSVNKPGLYSVRLNYAYKLGDNPGRSAQGGKDADGRSDSGRLWLMGQLTF